MHSRLLYWVLILLVASFALTVGCGDDDDDDDNDSGDDDTGDDDDNDTGDDDTGDDDDNDEERLYAGVGRARLNVPIGISLGGSGLREGPRSPFNGIMGGSDGYYDWPLVKAVVLQKGDIRIVFAKSAICFPNESLRTQIVGMVFDRTGVDLDRGLIINGNHTHSGPARFWGLPDLFGFFGMDLYHQDIADRVAQSFADVIVEALENMEPARIGVGYREAFDPEQRFGTDRNCENGPGIFKEDRLWVGEVTKDDGTPIAVLTSMAMHGVVFEDTNITGDAPDGVERAVEDLYDHPVTAIYLQGSAGDVSVRRDSDVGHRKHQIVEWIGYEVAQIIKDVEASIVFDARPALNVLTKRLQYDRETIGYQPGEFVQNMPGGAVEYGRGAFFCGEIPMDFMGSIVDCDNPDTSLLDGYLGCAINLGWTQFDDVMPGFMQAPITTARIGDQLFFTLPGEPTSHLAVDIRTSLAEAMGVPYENTNIIGYAQDHLFYLLQDWEWFQGGFEMGMSLFGWKFGPYLEQEVVNLALLLDLPEFGEPENPEPDLYYEESDSFEVEISEQSAGFEVQPVSSTRFDTVQFTWHGGHPGVDNFAVTLQHQMDDEFVDVKRKNGWPYDDAGWEIRVHHTAVPTYEEDLSRDSRDFQYTASWETSWDDPSGTLRFRVAGNMKTDSGVQEYEIFSEPFDLEPSTEVSLTDLSATVSGSQIAIRLEAAYPPNPDGWRMRSPLAGGSAPAYVTAGSATATISAPGYEDVNVTLVYDEGAQDLIGSANVFEAGVEHTIAVNTGNYDDGQGNTNASPAAPITLIP